MKYRGFVYGLTLWLIVFFYIPLTFSEESGVRWWDQRWKYRLPVMVQSGEYERIDKPVELKIDFTNLFGNIQAIGGELDVESIRVIQVKRSGEIVGRVQHQFDKAENYDALRNAEGTLIWMIDEMPAESAQYYHVYFDTLHGKKKSQEDEFAAKVKCREIDDDHWEISAHPYGFYTFQKSGGTFRIFAPKEVEDNHEGDWVRFDHSHYQGIPNMHSPDFSTLFHQRYEGLEASDGEWKVESRLVQEGELKVTIRSQHVIESGISEGTWAIVYEMFPSTIRCTVTQGNKEGFALIHEVTPGGNEYEKNDFVRLSIDEKKRRPGEGDFNEDISPEWAYQGEDGMKKKLYFIHMEDDAVNDAVLEFSQYHFWVVGWGRGAGKNTVRPGINSYPARFYFGFIEAENHEEMKTFINSLRDPLTILTLPVETVDAID